MTRREEWLRRFVVLGLVIATTAAADARADDGTADDPAAVYSPITPGEFAVRFTATVNDPQNGCLTTRKKGTFKLRVVKTAGGYAVAIISPSVSLAGVVIRYQPPISAHYEFGSYVGVDPMDGRTLEVTPSDPRGRTINGTMYTGEPCRPVFIFNGTWKRALKVRARR